MYSSYTIKRANSSRGSLESTLSILNNNKCQSKNVYDNSLLINDDSDSTLHTINTQMHQDMFNQSEISNIQTISSHLNKNTKDKEECNKRCLIYNNNNN